MTAARVAAILTILGLLIQLRGAYVAAMMFQPLPLLAFLTHVPRVLRASLFGMRPGDVMTPGYRAAVNLKKEVLQDGEASYLVAGLVLLVAGTFVQLIGAALFLWSELRPPD